jgi:hypothetical protein
MNAQRAGRRLLAGALLAAGLLTATAASASAATTATFSPGTGALTVFGDSADNVITISRDATASSWSTTAPSTSRAARRPLPAPPSSGSSPSRATIR